MIYNEILQWLFLVLLLRSVMKNERTMGVIVTAFVVLNKWLLIKDTVEPNDDEQN